MKKVAFPIAAILVLALPTVAFANGPTVVATVSYDIVTVDSGVFGGYWAYDYVHSDATVWDLGDNQYRVVFIQSGYFVSWAGPSPGNTGTIGDGVTGSISGAFVVLINGELREGLDGYLGYFDFGCDHDANCPSYVSWKDLLFEEYGSSSYEIWGWTYSTCGNGFWVNADYDNFGDITGEYVACVANEPKPAVTGLYAFVNPAEDRNICYILSNGMPGIERDVQRLCFTEENPDWWMGASFLVSGDVYEDGTDWGFWKGDAVARAYSGALRLPLHADGPDNDLFDLAHMYPWTQE
jgi:hypothetical protein